MSLIVTFMSVIVGMAMLPSAAWSQSVTLKELEGATVEFTAVWQQRTIRNGRAGAPELHAVGQIRFGSGGTINTHFENSLVGPWGRRVGPTRSNTRTIGTPGKDQQGNDSLWTFSDGSLIRLTANHQGNAGGQILRVVFRRGANGLNCSFSGAPARESGVGQIRSDSYIDDMPVQVVSSKMVSSQCRVTLH